MFKLAIGTVMSQPKKQHPDLQKYSRYHWGMLFLSPPQSLFWSCNLPHFISHQTPLKTSDWLTSCHLCDDQMSRLDIYEDHGWERDRKKKRLHVVCVFVFFLFFVGGLGSCDIKPCQRSKSLGRPLSGAYRTPERQDFADDLLLVYLQHVVFAFAKIYLRIFLSYIENIKSELYTENRCGDRHIFYRLC